MTKRDLFAELMRGVHDMSAQRQGKLNKLCSNLVKNKPALETCSQDRVEDQGAGCLFGQAGGGNPRHG